MQGKLKTNWPDHFGVVENVLDTDSVMSLQKKYVVAAVGGEAQACAPCAMPME